MTARDFEFLASWIVQQRSLLNTGTYAALMVNMVDSLRTRYSNFDVLRWYQFIAELKGMPTGYQYGGLSESELRAIHGDR